MYSYSVACPAPFPTHSYHHFIFGWCWEKIMRCALQNRSIFRALVQGCQVLLRHQFLACSLLSVMISMDAVCWESPFLFLNFKKNFLLFFGCIMQHVGSYFTKQGSNSCPLHWKHGVLSTGPPGKSLRESFFFEIINNKLCSLGEEIWKSFKCKEIFYSLNL